MSLKVFPAVVWALDDLAEGLVLAWYAKLDSQTKHFVRVAASKDGVRGIVQEYATEDFGRSLPPLGLSRPENTRVRVVMVGAVMGPDAVGDWAAVEADLDGLEGEVLSLDRVRVGVALHTALERERRQVQVQGTRGAAWLLSTRLSSSEAISRERLQVLLGRLMVGLLLAEPRVVADASTVWDQGGPGLVKLFGYPEQDPDEALQLVVKAVSTRLLFDLRASSGEEDLIDAGVRKAMLAAATKVASGELRAEQGLRIVLGEAGLAGATPRQLLAHAPDELRRVLGRLEATRETKPPTPAPSLGQRWWRWIQRLLGRAPALPQQVGAVSGADEAEVAHFKARAELARDLLDRLSAAAGNLPPAVTPPAQVQDVWRKHFAQTLKAQLRCLGGEVGGSPRSADEILADLSKTVRASVAPRLFESGVLGGISDSDIQNPVKRLIDPRSIRFTGCLVGGHRPQIGAVACSEGVVVSWPLLQSYRYWRAAGVVLFCASEPLEPSQLAW